jgi:hypothetical protein
MAAGQTILSSHLRAFHLVSMNGDFHLLTEEVTK